MNNNIDGRVNYLINDPLFFHQSHVVNQLLKPLMYLIRLGVTNKPRMYQVMYYVYKTDNYMKEHNPKLKNT